MTAVPNTTGVLPLVLAVAVGCTSPQDSPPPPELTVFAASSLKEPFEALANAFEAAHAPATVRLVFAGSQALRVQIEHGAPADVYASANHHHIDDLVAAGALEVPVRFATNELAVVVPAAGAEHIQSFEDLVRAETIVVGAPSVPIGAYTEALLDRTRETVGPRFAEAARARIASLENNARLVRSKVELGEADAAIVYRTDAASSGRVRTIDVPAEINVRAQYLAGRVAGTRYPDLADAWLRLLGSDEGRRVLARHRFGVD